MFATAEEAFRTRVAVQVDWQKNPRAKRLQDSIRMLGCKPCCCCCHCQQEPDCRTTEFASAVQGSIVVLCSQSVGPSAAAQGCCAHWLSPGSAAVPSGGSNPSDCTGLHGIARVTRLLMCACAVGMHGTLTDNLRACLPHRQLPKAGMSNNVSHRVLYATHANNTHSSDCSQGVRPLAAAVPAQK
jgi:hypothetical protein